MPENNVLHHEHLQRGRINEEVNGAVFTNESSGVAKAWQNADELNIMGGTAIQID